MSIKLDLFKQLPLFIKHKNGLKKDFSYPRGIFIGLYLIFQFLCEIHILKFERKDQINIEDTGLYWEI